MIGIKEIAEKTNSIIEQGSSIKIIESGTLKIASEILRSIKLFIVEVKNTFEPMKKKAWEAHKEIVAQEKKHLKPLEEVEKNIKQKMGRYHHEEEERINKEKEKIRQELKLLEEERKIKEALLFEEVGNVEKAEEILNSEIIIPEVFTENKTNIPGVSYTKIYKFRIIDVDQIPRKLLIPDEKRIGQIVRALKEDAKIPGVEVYFESSVKSKI